MTRVQVKADLLRWACERSGLDQMGLSARFPQLRAWEPGDKQPTFKQLESFAKAARTPIGFLSLPEPPVERVPIPDLRIQRNRRLEAPSLDLLLGRLR